MSNIPPTLGQAFTPYGQGFLHALVNQVKVSEAYQPSTHVGIPPQSIIYQAIWDTGATHTVITSKVATGLGLQPTGIGEATGIDGPKKVSKYLVNVFLPHGVAVLGVAVSECKELPGCDVLIGMDIIRLGDFAVSNFGGKTVFSFRCPSLETIDFVHQQPAKTVLPSPSRNKIKEQRRQEKSSRKKAKKDRKGN